MKNVNDSNDPNGPNDPNVSNDPNDPNAPLPEPRMSRRAAWMAMGSVALALGLLWAASDLSEPPADEDLTTVVAGNEEDDTKAIGKTAPLDFTVKDMNGRSVKLSSYKGKVILLNFWATWCEPCKEEIPDLITLQEQYKDDIIVLGFSIDDPAEKLRANAAEYKVNYPMLDGDGH